MQEKDLEATKANSKLNADFYGEDNRTYIADGGNSNTETEEANENLNKDFYKGENKDVFPSYINNNTPAIKINPREK